MPPLLPVPSTLRMRLNGTYQGQPWVAIQHWKYQGGVPNAVGLQAICNSFVTHWLTNIAPICHTTVGLTTVEGWDLATADGAYAISTSPGGSGTLIGTALPVSAAAVVTWKVQYRWRGGHPRTYWPAGDTSKLSNGRSWLQAFQTSMATANSGFLSGVNSIVSGSLSGHLVCVRREHTLPDGTLEKFDPPLVLDVIGSLVDSRLDSQRRRLGPDVAA